jgi:two-component system, CAI-1 autoinducer sensor kinase/phosphatase CqsS
MRRVLKHPHRILFDFFEFFENKIKLLAYLGVIGYPIYFFIWTYWHPQLYENISLRLCCMIISIAWFGYKYVPSKFRLTMILFFFLSVFFCIPFFFSFMWIKNEFSNVWTLSFLAQIFILNLIIYNWTLILTMVLFGFGLAGFYIYLIDGQVSLEHLHLEYIPVIAFTVIPGFIFHIHQKKHQETELILSMFGRTIAHEMRNSLAISIGSGRIIAMIMDSYPKPNNKQKIIKIGKDDYLEINEVLDQLQKSSFRTNMVINMILKNLHVRRIDKQNFSKIEIFDVVDTAVNDFGYKDDDRKKVQISDANFFTFLGEKELMIMVLFNLLKNSLDINENNEEIEIRIWTETGDKYNYLYFQDNGIGISKNHLPLIFNRYSTFNKKSGAGMGLHFCSIVMEGFGGTIYCESRENKYTLFTMRFPA